MTGSIDRVEVITSIQRRQAAGSDFPTKRPTRPSSLGGTFMTMLFRVRRDERRAWVVLVENQLYGEYLGKDQAVTDAIEAVNDARVTGCEAEVWDEANTLRLY
jgi:hypothetical protein